MADAINNIDFIIILIGVLLILFKLPVFFWTKDSQKWLRLKIANPKKKKNVQHLGIFMLVLFSFFSYYLLQTMNLARALATFVVFALFFYGILAIAYPKYIQTLAKFWSKSNSLRAVSLLASILGLIMILLVTYWPYR